jgi:hypothetical protein
VSHLQQGGIPQVVLSKWDRKKVLALWVLVSPLSRAEHRRCGREKACGLSEIGDGGRVSARSDRIGDAQEEAGHGRVLLLRFLFT